MQVVGEKVYLPNIIFRLVPNFTSPGKPYNPYEGTFRIPQSVTKTYVRAYLAAMYGVQTTYIRTDNYFAPVRRAWNGAWVRAGRSYRTYKRAVVGLVEPFYYPKARTNTHASLGATLEVLNRMSKNARALMINLDLMKDDYLYYSRKEHERRDREALEWTRGQLIGHAIQSCALIRGDEREE